MLRCGGGSVCSSSAGDADWRLLWRLSAQSPYQRPAGRLALTAWPHRRPHCRLPGRWRSPPPLCIVHSCCSILQNSVPLIHSYSCCTVCTWTPESASFCLSFIITYKSECSSVWPLFPDHGHRFQWSWTKFGMQPLYNLQIVMGFCRGTAWCPQTWLWAWADSAEGANVAEGPHDSAVCSYELLVLYKHNTHTNYLLTTAAPPFICKKMTGHTKKIKKRAQHAVCTHLYSCTAFAHQLWAGKK